MSNSKPSRQVVETLFEKISHAAVREICGGSTESTAADIEIPRRAQLVRY